MWPITIIKWEKSHAVFHCEARNEKQLRGFLGSDQTPGEVRYYKNGEKLSFLTVLVGTYDE